MWNYKKLFNSKKPKVSNVQRAQTLYYINNANHVTMMQNGEYDEYKKYNIPKDLEQQWSRDIKNKLFKKVIDNNDFAEVYSLAKIENLDESELLACFQFFAESDNAHDIWMKIETCKQWYAVDRYEIIKTIFDSKKEIDTEKAQQLLEVAIQRYNAFFHESFDGKIYLLTYGEAEMKRKELYVQLDADFEDFQPFAMGEIVSGRNGIAVLLYPFNMWRENDFYTAVYQEFGHFIFQKRNKTILRGKEKFFAEKSKKYGYDLLNAFIAKATVNLLNENHFRTNNAKDCLKAVSRQLYRALPGINPEDTSDCFSQKWNFSIDKIKVFPDALGVYCAMILTDPILIDLMQKDPGVERGFSACNQQIVAIVEDIIEWLANYLKKHPDYTFFEEELSALGEMILRLEQAR